MKKKIVLLGIWFGIAGLAVAQTVPLNVQKTAGTNAITGDLVIGSGRTLSASGTGTIGATSVIYATSVTETSGTGTPEGAVTANIGSVFHRTDGSTGTTLYIKESGTGNTGWAAVSAGGGSGTVNSGTANQLAYYAGSGTAVSGLTSANNGVLVTSSSGVPSISSTLPNSITVSSSSGTGLINLNAPTGSSAIFDVKINSSDVGFLGVAGAADSFITGAVTGDLILRSNTASSSLLFSNVSSGGGITFQANSSGTQVNSAGTTSQIIGNSPSGFGSIVQLQINGTGKLFVGAAGVANNYITGAVTDDAFVRVDNGDFLIGTAGGSNIALRVVKTTGAVLALRPTAGLGYGTGAGGTVTQSTNKTTGVTLNTVTGAITLNNASLSGITAATFTLTNSAIAATDVVIVNIKSGATVGSYQVSVDSVSAGSCQITLYNYTVGALGEAVVINFAVIKGVTS